MSNHVCIGTKIVERGIVWDASGDTLGRAIRASRVAAGTKGRRGSFYTAVVATGNTDFTGTSLGTRHKTRASAVRAIRMFWAWYDTEGYKLTIHQSAIAQAWRPNSMESVVSHYKRSYPSVCALPARKVR